MKKKQVGQALELRRTQVVRWAKAPQIVTPDLRRKEHLNRREKLWVYGPLYALLFSVCLNILACVWLAAPVTNKDSAGVLFVISGALGVLVGIITGSMVVSKHDDPIEVKKERYHAGFDGNGKYKERFVAVKPKDLSFEGRKRLALFDRNRKRMPWYKERLARYADADGQYTQLSVWVEAKGKDVSFMLLEHTRRGRLRPWGVQIYTHKGELCRSYLTAPSVDDIIEKQHELEELAREAEGMGYNNAIGTHILERDVLRLRR